MNGLRNFAAALGPRKLMIMASVALVLLIGIGAIAWRGSSSSEMGFLYTDLDPEAAQSITEKLKGQGIPFSLSPDGTAITAPVDKLPELRMAMASERLGGKIGYAVLDAEEPFGVSSSRSRLNETRAIEGELVRSIESLERVNKARVHLVMPERAMFAAESRKATASVTLNTQGRLPREAVQSIRYLVASAVPELSPESVSIVDQAGTLLARAGEDGDTGSDMQERQSSEEARLRSQIETMIEPIVGQGKVRAEVAVALDRDQVREEAEVFDPDKQVIAHQVTVESNDQNNERDAGAEGATVATQLPDNQGGINGNGGESRQSARNENSEDTTFENSRTHTVSVRSPGKVSRLTVAVMVDGGPKGLPQPQIQRLTRLVENAVGFDAERGDSVVVESMPFAAPDALEGESGRLPFGLTGGNVLNLVELLVLLGAVLFGVRMLRPKTAPDGDRQALLAADADQIALEARAAGGDLEAMQMLLDHEEVPMLDQEIDLAQVDGRIRLSALKKIGNTISGSPAESASVIRQWMNT